MSRDRSIAAALVFLALVALVGVVSAFRAASVTPPSVASTTDPVRWSAPPQQSVLWLGDSYAAGAGLSPHGVRNPGLADGYLTAGLMGWRCILSAESGTGFVADGRAVNPNWRPFKSRLKWLALAYDPDVVVIDGGRSDVGISTSRIEDAVRATVADTRRAWPRSRIVVVAPYRLGRARSLFGASFDEFLNGLSRQWDFQLIDPFREGWSRPLAAAGMLDARTGQPTLAGHRYVARQIAGDLLRNIATAR